METITKRLKTFTKERDWDQFHTPANLSKSIIIEAAELLEHFQWNDWDYDMDQVKEELADVILYALQLAMVLDVDLEEILNQKMNKNEKKYPVEKAYGSSKKYSAYERRDHEDPI